MRRLWMIGALALAACGTTYERAVEAERRAQATPPQQEQTLTPAIDSEGNLLRPTALDLATQRNNQTGVGGSGRAGR